MKILRRKMVMTFLVITFIASICDNIIDFLAQNLEPKIESSPELAVPAVIGLLLLNVLVYVISAYVFFRITKKNIRKESERQVHEKDLIYAAVVHDLKTPMTSVQGFAKALSDGKIKPEEQQEIFDIIYRKSNSMNEMVDTLFDYARLGTDGYKPTLEQTDICTLVRDTVAESYCDFEEHEIALDIDIPDKPMLIKADKTQLKRAVTNLIVNIYKHNPDGISAKISVAEEGGKAVIRIADSGDPLPDGVDIFKPFVTENTARTVGQGTGLGLAVTKRVIESHGGTIGVETTIPGYTKMFVIRL
jgi:signal transduction histidine kinase